MKRIIQKFGMTLALLLSFLTMSAYDFEVDGIAYTITSLTDLTVSFDQVLNKDLTVINIPQNVEYKNKTLTVTSVANNACIDNENLTMISLPETIVSIGSKAFMNNKALVEIKIPKSTISIGSESFSGCVSITSMLIPEGLKQINYRVFYNCSSLLNVNIQSDIQSIGESAFESSGLRTITIPSSLKSLGKRSFALTQLETIELPDGIDVIPNGCFAGCSKLSKVSFSSQEIEASAFSDCVALKQIELPSNLRIIHGYAFRNCESLDEFIIPANVEKIEPDILWGCSTLKTLQIGSGLNGLPVSVTYSYNGSYTSTISKSIGSYYYYSPSYSTVTKINIPHLENVKNLIIDDAPENFSIKGFQLNGNITTPAFANLSLDYYYVGRPLVDIQKWSSSSTGFTVTANQGIGKIKKLEIGGFCTSVPYFYQKIDTLVLGDKISYINLNNLYKDDLVKIKCLSKLPPRTSGDFPTRVYTDVTLYVPKGCKNVYENTDIWKNFWNIIETEEGDNTSGIIAPFENESAESVFRVYNISGYIILQTNDYSELKRLPKGIYIISNKSKRWKIKI